MVKMSCIKSSTEVLLFIVYKDDDDDDVNDNKIILTQGSLSQ